MTGFGEIPWEEQPDAPDIILDEPGAVALAVEARRVQSQPARTFAHPGPQWVAAAAEPARRTEARPAPAPAHVPPLRMADFERGSRPAEASERRPQALPGGILDEAPTTDEGVDEAPLPPDSGSVVRRMSADAESIGPQGRLSRMNFLAAPRRAPLPSVSGPDVAAQIRDTGAANAADWLRHNVEALRMGAETGEGVGGVEDDGGVLTRLSGGDSNWPPDYVFVGNAAVSVSGSPSEATPWLWVDARGTPTAEWKSTPRPLVMEDGVQVFHAYRKELHISRLG